MIPSPNPKPSIINDESFSQLIKVANVMAKNFATFLCLNNARTD